MAAYAILNLFIPKPVIDHSWICRAVQLGYTSNLTLSSLYFYRTMLRRARYCNGKLSVRLSVCLEVAYALSISAKINDLGWPWSVIIHPVSKHVRHGALFMFSFTFNLLAFSRQMTAGVPAALTCCKLKQIGLTIRVIGRRKNWQPHDSSFLMPNFIPTF